MTSPCGKIRIPINESSDEKSQIQEYLDAYKGEGIQHIALGSDDILKSVDGLRGLGMGFMDAPPATRSAERRVGTECGSKCRSRGAPYHLNKKQTKPQQRR